MQSPIGKVMEVAGAVTIEHNALVVVQASLSTAAPPKTGDSVYKGDLIQTGTDGKVALVFADGTTFNVARNARIELNEFIYDPNSKANTAKFSVVKGTLTFIAGQTAKTGSMTLNTPVGTMGIRGTTPKVEVMENGKVKFSTLVEDDRTTARTPGAKPPAQRQGRSTVTPSQDVVYDRFMRLRPKVCTNC